MSKIEEVARAIEKAGFKWIEEHDDCGWADIPEEVFARAALLAIREPDEGMMLAGVKAEQFRSLGSLKVGHIWRDMIDAALTEEKG